MQVKALYPDTVRSSTISVLKLKLSVNIVRVLDELASYRRRLASTGRFRVRKSHVGYVA